MRIWNFCSLSGQTSVQELSCWVIFWGVLRFVLLVGFVQNKDPGRIRWKPQMLLFPASASVKNHVLAAFKGFWRESSFCRFGRVLYKTKTLAKFVQNRKYYGFLLLLQGRIMFYLFSSDFKMILKGSSFLYPPLIMHLNKFINGMAIEVITCTKKLSLTIRLNLATCNLWVEQMHATASHIDHHYFLLWRLIAIACQTFCLFSNFLVPSLLMYLSNVPLTNSFTVTYSSLFLIYPSIALLKTRYLETKLNGLLSQDQFATGLQRL